MGTRILEPCLLEPFKPWTNCTLADAKVNNGSGRITRYAPMDAPSMVKDFKESPGAGLLVPTKFAKKVRRCRLTPD